MPKFKLRRGRKYNSAERRIARRIYDLKNNQNRCYHKWHELDLQIHLLKNKLCGKYDG